MGELMDWLTTTTPLLVDKPSSYLTRSSPCSSPQRMSLLMGMADAAVASRWRDEDLLQVKGSTSLHFRSLS